MMHVMPLREHNYTVVYSMSQITLLEPGHLISLCPQIDSHVEQLENPIHFSHTTHSTHF